MVQNTGFYQTSYNGESSTDTETWNPMEGSSLFIKTSPDDGCPDEKCDFMEDFSLICGILLTVGFIFVMRNISILAGVNLPLSGNHNMIYTNAEPWRYVFFLFSLFVTGIYAWKLKKKSKGLLQKAYPYIRLFVIGVLLIICGEAVLWRLAYGLR